MTKKKSSGKGLSKKYPLSAQLQAVVGKGPLSRPEVTKKIWNHIKKHDLQHPKHKRFIEIDETLDLILSPSKSKKVRKGDKVASIPGHIHMFDMTKQISNHIGQEIKTKKNPYEDDEDFEDEDDLDDEYFDEDEDEDDYDDY